MLNKCWNRLAVVLAVGTVLAVGLVGCNETEVPEAEVIESEVIESEVVSETVSEEVSEEVISEAESESVEEENGGVEYIYCSGMAEFEEYLKGLDKTAIVEYNFGIEDSFQAIISNGANYTMQLGNIIGVRSNKEVLEVVANVDGIDIYTPVRADIWGIMINTTGTDIEVSCTIKYADGTEEDFTIYVTLGEDAAEGIDQASTSEVEYVNFANKAELMTYLEELNQTTIVDYNFTEGTEQAIIPNGGKYTLNGDDDNVNVISTGKTISEIKTNVDYISVQGFVSADVVTWMIFIETTGTDIEVPFTVMYDDGTSEDFTIYVTVDEVM